MNEIKQTIVEMKLNIKKILVPTDFSEASLNALEYAAFLGKKLGAKIILFHVYEHEEINKGKAITNYAELLEKGIHQKMDDIKASNSTLWGIKIDTKTSSGKAYREIEKTVQELGIDLVIMGTHGNEGLNFEKYFLGTNAYRTIHESTCPVLTVRKKGKTLSCADILLPLDVTKETAQKIEWAIEWAKVFKSRIHLVAVTEFLDEFITDINRLTTLLKETETRLLKENIDFTSKLFRNSTLSKTVLTHAKKVKADFLIIMSKKDKKWGEFIVEPADRKIIGECQIPVLSLRPREPK